MRQYPYVIKINGQTVAGFNEVTGLTSDSDPVDYRDGEAGTSHPRKLTNSGAPKRITLTRGVVHDPAFAAWLKQPRIPHLVTIEHINAAGVTVWSRQVKDCAITATQVTTLHRT
jgi:phage tail-like protein